MSRVTKNRSPVGRILGTEKRKRDHIDSKSNLLFPLPCYAPNEPNQRHNNSHHIVEIAADSVLF